MTANAARASTAATRSNDAGGGRGSARSHPSASGPVSTLQASAGNSAVASLVGADLPRDGAWVPDIVRDTIRAPGEALDVDTRAQMESHFKRDLGAVRIHRDGDAASSADKLDAHAYTTGTRVVFGAGAYNPGSSDGRRLLAHELAHVIQQRDAARRTDGVSPADDVFEHAARSAAVNAGASLIESGGAPFAVQRAPKAGTKDLVTRWMDVGTVKVIDPRDLANMLPPAELAQMTIKFFELQKTIRAGLTIAGGGDAILGQILRVWKRNIEVAIEVVRTKLAGDAALMAGLKASYAGAIAAILPSYPDPGKTRLTMHELLEAHRADLHEWAWPTERADAKANVASDAIPIADRKRIKVISTTVIPPDQISIIELFSTKGQTRTILPPKGVTVEFSGDIPKTLQPGFENIVGLLTMAMKPTPPLQKDSTISLALDLGQAGGDYGMYRFTYFTEHEKGKAAKDRVLVERLGSLKINATAPGPDAEAQKRFTAHRFTFKGTAWRAAQRQTVLDAVALVPDARLTLVDGMAFTRLSDDPAHPKEGGNYDAVTHTVTLYDRAFKESSTRFGAPEAVVAASDAYDVLHEIGHAIDYRAERLGPGKVTAAEATLTTEFGEFADSPGSMQFIRVPNDRRARLNLLLAARDKALTEREKPKTESGHFVKNGELINDPSAKTAFRDAVAKDGNKRPTPYSDTAWEEAFAEGFALYTSDPATMQRLRPATFEFFRTKLPN